MPASFRFAWNPRQIRAASARALVPLQWLERGCVTVLLVLSTLELGGENLGAAVSSRLESFGLSLLMISALRWVVEFQMAESSSRFLRERGWFATVLVAGALAHASSSLTIPLSRFSAAPEVAGQLTLATGLTVYVLVAIRFLARVRTVSRRGTNPATTVAASFLLLIAAGSALLMLPACRVQPDAETRVGAPPLVAVFTATSAACVTGLVVVDTATYWSRAGQIVILALIQLGGLGIMTFGALFAVFAPSGMAMREHAFLGTMLEARRLSEVRKLLVAVLTMTLLWELGGAVLLWNLWPELPVGERAFHCLFHSVSAFCNAGFALRSAGLVGWGERWEVWGVIAGLVIAGGLGFATLGNLAGRIGGFVRKAAGRSTLAGDWTRRLSLSSRIAIVMTITLLILGTLAVYWLEGTGQLSGRSPGARWKEAWFQSVTFRTAGFNTTDQAALHPATKFVGIVWMFIGGSPGATAGGIKTLPVAILILAVWALLRGRERVEIGHRTIGDEQVKRAGTVIVLGLSVVATTTFLLVAIENQPDRFLDHLFEATSAFATVGLSSVDTAKLSSLSQAILTATMFLGRVGPLTLLVALSSRKSPPSYDYPVERVMLG